MQNILLSSEQIALLKWLREQTEPVSLRKMEVLNAPGYTPQRIEALTEEGYIVYNIGSVDGAVSGVYSISDLGLAVLTAYDKEKHEQEQEEKSKKFDRKFQLLNTVLGALVGSALTLLVEHFDAVLEIIRAFGK